MLYMDDQAKTATTEDKPPQASWFVRHGPPTVVLLISAGISAISILYLIGRSVACLISLGCPTSTMDMLAMLGVFNFVLLFPVAWLFVRRYKQGKLFTTVNIVLVILSVLPAGYIILVQGSEFIGRVSEPLRRSDEIKVINDQLAIARAAHITLAVAPGTIEKSNVQGDTIQYTITLPLIIENVPDGLNAYLVTSAEMYDHNGKKIYSSDFYPDFGDIRATKTNGVWQYSTYDWRLQKEVVGDKPIFLIKAISTRPQTLPIFSKVYLYMNIPTSPNQYGGGMIVDDTFVTSNKVDLKITEIK